MTEALVDLENICQKCMTVRIGNSDHMEKCKQWLENCGTSDGNSTCDSEDSSELKSTEDGSSFDGFSYDSDGKAIVDKIRLKGECGIDPSDLEHVISNSRNIFHNVNINKSRKIHLGNVTYINGPVYINKTTNTINQVSTINEIKIRSKVRYFDRPFWVAQPPTEEISELKDPAKVVIICHTASEDTDVAAENILHIRLIQQFHIESKKFSDIAYNFLIGNDGNTYVGRGWGKEGSHTFRYNRFSVGIAFIGCYINKLPCQLSLEQAKHLIEEGVNCGYIDPNYSLIGHCQCISTASPGNALYEELKNWKNFDSDISLQNPHKLLLESGNEIEVESDAMKTFCEQQCL